jgi:hypothetical protein
MSLGLPFLVREELALPNTPTYDIKRNRRAKNRPHKFFRSSVAPLLFFPFLPHTPTQRERNKKRIREYQLRASPTPDLKKKEKKHIKGFFFFMFRDSYLPGFPKAWAGKET